MLVCDRCGSSEDIQTIKIIKYQYTRKILAQGKPVFYDGLKPYEVEVDLCQECIGLLAGYNDLFMRQDSSLPKIEVPLIDFY